jgi:hypothetical protein
MINRFSSRVNNLGEVFSKDALTDAVSYNPFEPKSHRIESRRYNNIA